jgi:predicted dehydrogenase
MTKPHYRAVIIGLTSIGASRPQEDPGVPLYGKMPDSHSSAYHHHPQTEVVAVCDIRQDALSKFKSTWQDVWSEVRFYTNYVEMFEKEKPDIVSVVTPDHLHADIVVAAVQIGARAILCEKPIATSLEDADRMIEAAEARGVVLSIEHTRRWDPTYLKARQIIRSGQIGPLRAIVVEQFGPRAMLFRNGTHMMDIMSFFAEANPQWVVGELEEGFEHFTRYAGDGGHDPASEPFASAYIHFDNGVRAFYNAFKTDFIGSQQSLTCEKGRIEISDHGARLIRGKSYLGWEVHDIVTDSYLAERQLAAVTELIRVLENGGELVSPAREARKALEIILGILKSHHKGNVRVGFPLS